MPLVSDAKDSEASKLSSKESPLLAKARTSGAFDGKNLLLTAPTGTGKSYVGRALLLHYAASRPPGTTNTYLVPYRALAEEIYQHLKSSAANLRVRIATGDYRDPIDFHRTDILVATYEKFQSLLQRQSSRNPYRPYAIVMDEFHLIGTPDRGARVESLITHLIPSLPVIRLYPLSAAIGNPDQVASWLGIELLQGTEADRVVEVDYAAVEVDDKDEFIGKEISKLAPSKKQLLVFCNRKTSCQKQAELHSREVSPHLEESERRELEQYALRLEALGSGKVLRELATAVRNGCAFHHAGLEYEARMIIEEAYRKRLLRVIFATPTLASGVNLPAFEVIVRDAYRTDYTHKPPEDEYLSAGEILNMLGRAGRYGLSDRGVGYVLFERGREVGPRCQKWREEICRKLKNAVEQRQPDCIESHLGEFRNLLNHILLEINRSEDGVTLSSLVENLQCTFWGKTRKPDLRPVLTGGVGGKPFEQDIMEELEAGLKKSVKDMKNPVKGFSIEGFRIEADVKGSEPEPYKVMIEPDRISCTCYDFFYRKRYQGIPCKHITYLVYYSLFNPKLDPHQRKAALQICLDLYGSNVDPHNLVLQALSLLEAWSFLRRSEGRLIPTEEGRIAAASYLPLHTCYRVLEGVRGLSGNESVRHLLESVASDIAHAREDEKDYTDLLYSWIEEERAEILEREVRYFQDLLNLVDDARRILELYEDYARFLGKEELVGRLGVLRRRVEFGCREDLLPLLSLGIRNLGRARCRALFEQGIQNLAQLASIPGDRLPLKGIADFVHREILDAARAMNEEVTRARGNIRAAADAGIGAGEVMDACAADLAARFGMNYDDVVDFLLAEGK